MVDRRDEINLNYAGRLEPVRRTDPAAAVFVCALVFLGSSALTNWGGLHGELNPLFVLVWLVLGIVTTCLVAAAWKQRTWLGASTRLGRAGTVLTVFGWIIGCLIVFGPRYDPHASDVRRQASCASHLNQIGQAMLLYAHEHGGRCPDRPEELLPVGIEPEVFVCPSTDDVPATGASPRDISDAFASGGHLSYVYLGKGLTDKAGAEYVLAFEP